MTRASRSNQKRRNGGAGRQSSSNGAHPASGNGGRHIAKDDELLFLPLGGTGEIGMNLNLYGWGGRWLMVDLGVTFTRDGSLPGVEVLMPDPAFIEARRDQLDGLVLTHAHEDHIGAVGHLWDRLRCPIYATPFTAELVRPKLQEAGLGEAVVTEVPLSGRLSVGAFELELITLTHSIPEPNALVIRTPAGTILHTGDWKFDPDPVVGDDYDEDALRALSKEGVLALVCDSTNALVEGDSGSEGEIAENLIEVIGKLPGLVAVACFASNVARLESVVRAAERAGRRVALAGRSMHRIVEAAKATGYLSDLPPFLPDDQVGFLPREEVLILCTGSQGEVRAALWRIVRDDHPHITLEQGDTVIFSSRVIPGNETAIHALHNEMVRQGIEVISASDEEIHVSGHPARDELAQMYQWVRPQVSIPVHGEIRHLVEHAKLARECQVPQAIVGANGTMIRLAPGKPEIVDQVESGRLALDGNRLVAIDSAVLRERKKLVFNGAASVVVLLDEEGVLIEPPRITFLGVLDLDSEADYAEAASAAVEKAIERLPAKALDDDQRIREIVTSAIRKALNADIGKKPVTHVEVIRLEWE